MGIQDRRDRLERLTARAADVDAGLARLAAEADSLLPWMLLPEKRHFLHELRAAFAAASDPATVSAMQKSRPRRTPRLRDEWDRAAWLVEVYVGPVAGRRIAAYIEAARARRAAGLPALVKPIPPAHSRV